MDDNPNRDAKRLVAVYDFDPAVTDWPFNRQKPLGLTTGQVVEVIHDDGTEWALGRYVGKPETLGYFPKNFTVTVGEYHEMMRDFEDQMKEQTDEPAAADVTIGPPETRAIPTGPLPLPGTAGLDEDDEEQEEETAFDEKEPALPELVYPGLSAYPPIEARPPMPTVFEVNKSRLLREMPAVPDLAPEEPAPPEDDIVEARWQVEAELAQKEDIMDIAGGEVTHSRCSTPATHALTRPERDFVRKDISVNVQNQFLYEVQPLLNVVRKNVRVAWEEKPAYVADLRVRSTTLRVAAGIEPTHMRMALHRSNDTGAKWKQMFRPGFSDVINESFRVGCNSCILSRLYLQDMDAKQQFQRLHVQDVNGTLWFDLQRKKEHLFYMRMDFIDVMMCHPDAWGFPDCARIVQANPGETVNPFHGWYSQHSIDPDREMEDVEFRYNLRLRSFPETVFQALALGKVPEWIRPYLSLHAEAEMPNALAIDPDDEVDMPTTEGQPIKTEKNFMMEAGLEDSEDLYVKLDELRLARERTTGPDVLDADSRSYRLKGLSAMRIFLRSRGNPDNMKQALISPKMVKDMAAQLGILKKPDYYWYCLFALRYPLSPEWEAVVRDDTRWYINLKSDNSQPVHPMIKKFREHLSDIQANEFLWEFRGFVKMKCSECGLPDSVVWCQQCTDYFCANCFLQTHRSKRGKKHWPMPVPGSRYLTAAEAKRFSEHLPLLNIGFSNRRRFLSRDNQSDRDGARTGDSWLWFHVDTFQAALVQTPEKHWCLKRKEPPRLPPGVDGYFFNFATDTLADDVSYILTSTAKQDAISLVQKYIRGSLARRHIRKETEAALVIQKTKIMWDVQKVHGTNGKNAAIIKSWFRKHRGREDTQSLELKLSKLQAIVRGVVTRRRRVQLLRFITRIQVAWRGFSQRRKIAKMNTAALLIQKTLRGMIYGRRHMRRRHQKAAKIQAIVRGIMQRKVHAEQIAAATRIQARWRGMVGRARVEYIQSSAKQLQTNWRRFQAQINVKRILYERMEALRTRRVEILRVKLKEAAVNIIQRNWRRHRDYNRAVDERREKGDSDKRTTTLLVALLSGASALRHYVHPWWRHLPKPIQAVLKELKISLQRSIAILPVKGKLANEEIGKRGLTVASAEHLTYHQDAREPDPASHMLLCISRHLLAHVPAELFPETVKWAAYSIGHQAVKIFKTNGYFPKQEIPLGKEMPPHPNDTLHTLYKEVEQAKMRADGFLSLPEESLPMSILHSMPPHHRHVLLTAEVLVTMRQALDSPAISTDDHLKFQGLDASAGAQLMEVLGAELDHRLPLDWPNSYGTVSALATKLGTHVLESTPEGAKEIAKGQKVDSKAKNIPGQVAGQAPPKQLKVLGKTADGEKERRPDEDNHLSQFNRAAVCRMLQQVGYLIRDQHHVINSVLGIHDDAKKGEGVRQGRVVAMTDKLFDMADKAPHDHCSFTLAVVLFHMILRAMLMRLLYHRAAIALQKRYRYLKQKGKQRNSVAPAICIQRYWRGLRASLRIARQEHAAERIQHCWRACRWNKRANKLLQSTLTLQRVWKGALVRNWLRVCHNAATQIQRFGRGMMVRVVLDRFGRELSRKSQAEITAVVKKKNQLTESEYFARCAVLAGKAKIALHKHRERMVDYRRAMASTLKSKHARMLDKQKKLKMKGFIQPVRRSVFEPFSSSARTRETTLERYGAWHSKVLNHVATANKRLGRTLPADDKPSVRVHAAAKRGQAAMLVRIMGKKTEGTVPKQFFPDDKELNKWMAKTFKVKDDRTRHR